MTQPQPNLASSLDDDDKAKLLKAYPEWPWVSLGKLRDDCKPALPQYQSWPPLLDDQLKEFIDEGRKFLQVLLESNVKTIASWLKGNKDKVPGGDPTQRHFGTVKALVEPWTQCDNTSKRYLDNRGTVDITSNFPGYVNDVGEPTRRSHDAILSVLESLSVGNDSKKAGEPKHEQFRTINPIAYP